MRSFQKSRGFTLVELLIVIGIIALLIGILLPVLGSAQRAARDTKCKSNMRQVVMALLNYAADFKGKFPHSNQRYNDPNTGAIKGDWWCDVDRIGRYLPVAKVTDGDIVGFNYRSTILSPVLACPEDERGSRSYAMNWFASSGIKANNRVQPVVIPRAGKSWGPNAKEATKLILVVEMLSGFADGHGGFMSRPNMLMVDDVSIFETRIYPGEMFLGTNIPINVIGGPPEWYRYFPAETWFDWSRHRRKGDGGTRRSEARGRANFGFADGHVASFRADDLADRATKKSKFVALWSPLDYQVERLPRPN